MDSLIFAKRYFQETTVHGFRYVVEGTNVLPKLLWVSAIIAAFVMAGVMVTSNLNDIAENPMVSSIETVPVQEIPFPAVTLSGAYVGHPYRLMQSVLNTAIFDCIGPRWQRFNAMQEHRASKAERNCTKQVTAEPIDPFDFHNHEEQMKAPGGDCTGEYIPFYTTTESRCTGHSNLDSILESDECLIFGQKCLNESKEAWDDFHAAIEYAVFKRKEDRLFYWPYVSESLDIKTALDNVIEHLLCPVSGSDHEKLGEGMITKIFDLVNAHVNMEINSSKALDHQVIRYIASTFRRPLPNIKNAIVNYIEENYPAYEYVSDLPECIDIVNNISMAKYQEMAKFMDAAAMVSRHLIQDELRLGNLLLYAYTYFDNTDNFESLELLEGFQNLMELYNQVFFSEHDDGISLVQIIKVFYSVAPDMFCKYDHRHKNPGWTMHEDTTCNFKHSVDNVPPIEAILKTLKYMVLPTSNEFVEKSEYEDVKYFRQLVINKNYTLSDMKMKHEEYSILACKINDEEISKAGNCDLFSKSYTSGGVGYVFNSLPFWQMYKNTASNNVFYKEFVEKKHKNLDESPIKIEANGDSFSLDFYVRHQAYEYHRVGSKSQTVLLALDDPSFVPNLKADGIEIRAGKYYEISVTPTVTSTTESGLELDPEKRNCLSKSENDKLLIFETYSQTACIFECQLKKAIEHCDCTAWDYPQVSQSAKLCTTDIFSKEYECFKFIMNKPMKPEYCNCPNDCDSIYYDTSLHVKSLDNDEDVNQDDRDSYYFQAYLRPFVHNVEYFNKLFDEESDIKGIFRERYNQNAALSRVKIKIKTRVATKIVRSARATFSSQLANLGGIIGLFTGMSILSLAELAFWVLKFVRYNISKGNCCKKTWSIIWLLKQRMYASVTQLLNAFEEDSKTISMF